MHYLFPLVIKTIPPSVFNGRNLELGIVLEGSGYDGEATLVASKVTDVKKLTEVTDKLSEQNYNAECYDKNTSADFGWTDQAKAWYDEYFGDGEHNDIIEISPDT